MANGAKRKLRLAVTALAIIIIIILLLTPSFQNFIVQLLLSPFQERAPKYVIYRLERQLRVDANGGTVYNFTLDLPMPVNVSMGNRTLQEITSIMAFPEGRQSIRYGLPWRVWQHGPLIGTSKYIVTITYDIKVETQIWKIDAKSSGEVSDIPQSLRSAYLHDEWKIVMSDPAIMRQAAEITKGDRNVYNILQSIYEWMVANVRYSSSDSSGDPSSSVETLSSLTGDCDDQSILFCALARAAGVPAWLQLGALYDSQRDAWSGHGWVQAYVPFKDAGGELVCIDTVNRDFMIWKPNRLAEFTDDGDGQHLRDYYYSFTYTYDQHSYPVGLSPTYHDSYRSIIHQESTEKVLLAKSGFCEFSFSQNMQRAVKVEEA
ncbi:MAG: transglutaminase-like domain-containing protein [Methanomassiliicoccales archaeon]